MSKKSSMVLGYTRTGIAVLLPTSRVSDSDNFVGWSPGDHKDAYRILAEHGEREADPDVGPWCVQWSKAHRDLAKARKVRKKSNSSIRVRGAAETAIRSIRRRR